MDSQDRTVSSAKTIVARNYLVLMVALAETPSPPQCVTVFPGTTAAGARSTSMTANTTSAKMGSALMLSTPLSVVAILVGRVICVSNPKMSAGQSHVKMEASVRNCTPDTSAGVPPERKANTVNPTSMSATPTLVSMGTA